MYDLLTRNGLRTRDLSREEERQSSRQEEFLTCRSRWWATSRVLSLMGASCMVMSVKVVKAEAKFDV